jgi:simple sugar transport system ATP-binding protein
MQPMSTPVPASGNIPFAVQMHDIVKRFPGGVVANDGITLDVRQGEIHALLGENGAGKSTLMNILFGIHAADRGNIFVNGRQTAFRGPREAVDAGLGMVHQHFMLIPRFTVTENVILGSEGDAVVLDREDASRRVRELAHQYKLDVDPDARLGDLPVGTQQRVEILRALYQGSRVLILDEPTALLTPQEVEDLYGVLNRLKEDGGTIIFITHKLREIAAISDRVTVIRRGTTVGTRNTAETTPAELAELMVGREVNFKVDKTAGLPGETVLTGENLVVNGHHDHKHLDIDHIELHRGEILGVCGIEGNGQSWLVEVLSGIRNPDGGTVMLRGKDVTSANPNTFRDHGLSYIPEDRHNRGLVLDFPLWENVLLGNAWHEPFTSGGRINRAATRQITTGIMQEFDVRAPGPDVTARTLSGGNQQKLIIAREMYRDPDVLLAIQPTRGLDVGAIEFVHRQIINARDKGKAVLVLSFDLDEVLDLSDRLVVLYGGRIVGNFRAGEISRTELGLLMGGRAIHE